MSICWAKASTWASSSAESESARLGAAGGSTSMMETSATSPSLTGSSVSVGAGMFVRSVSSLVIAYPFTGTVRMNRKLRGGLASLALKSVRG